MTTKLIPIIALVGWVGVLGPAAARAQTPVAAVSSAEIAKIEAQEFSRSLAQLKIQEVALQRAIPVDEKALALNRAQQSALNQELIKLSVAPTQLELQRLESERASLASDLRPAHPKMIALQAQIDQAKATIAATH